MLGKEIRSYHHLNRLTNSEKAIKMLYIANGRVDYAKAVKCTSRDYDGDPYHPILFFNSRVGTPYSKMCRIEDETARGIYEDLMKNEFSRCLWIYNFEDGFSSIQGSLILIDEDMEKEYAEFKKQNPKIFSSILEKYSVSDDPTLLYFYLVCEGSPNLFNWMCVNRYKHRIIRSAISVVTNWCVNNKELLKKLSRGTPTAYNGEDGITLLIGELIALKRLKRANMTISKFNTAQKKLLKDTTLGDNDILTLSRFLKLSETKQLNFVRKMSTVDSAAEILRNMELLTMSKFQWSKESLFAYMEANSDNFNLEIVYDKGDVVVIMVKDFETIKHLAKTTNWCISKNKRYWNDYLDNYGETHNKIRQYMMFDFSKKEDDELSIVGFTTKTNYGITHAHSFTNKNMIRDTILVDGVNSFRRKTEIEIVSELEDRNIPVDKFFEISKYLFDWNKDAFLKFLEKNFDDSHYDILYDEGNELFISISVDYVKYIVGEGFYKSLRYDMDAVSDRALIAFDFSKPLIDPNHMLYMAAGKMYGDESECQRKVYDSFSQATSLSVNVLLNKYGLPFNTLKRADSLENKFRTALYDFNVSELDSIFKSKEFKKYVKEGKCHKYSSDIYSPIQRSIYDVKTMDVLDCLIRNDIELKDLIVPVYIDNLVSDLAYSVKDYYNEKMFIPTEKDLEHLFDGSLDEVSTDLIGYYFTFKKLLETIKDHSLDAPLTNTIECFSRNNDNKCMKGLAVLLARKFIYDDSLYETNDLGVIRSFLTYLVYSRNEEAIKELLDTNMSKALVKHVFDVLPSDWMELKEQFQKKLESLSENQEEKV